ncbi:RNA recognition domain-containing protein [Phlyctema vagabunda]|uniref:RNA recognition domain-containing protein n=1 Tax=Phlyctema vagabunda TaxID=108571 RepID=A0ABR4P703_9HELO
MNSIRQIQELNKRELENGVSPEASWHTDYRDTAYIYVGGLPYELSEGDVITIFSQFGEPTYINLVRDKETGKSKGFAFLKYEDQRSTDLAVDNLGGAVIMGKTLKVDHTRYKKKDDEPDEGISLDNPHLINEDGNSGRKRRRTDESDSELERPMLKEERELAKLMQDHDDDDPMKAFLIQEKKEEVSLALAKTHGGKHSSRERKHKHHHRSRRPRDDRETPEDGRGSRHHRDDRERMRPLARDSEALDHTKAEARHSRPREEDEVRDHTFLHRSRPRDSQRRERTPDYETGRRRQREESRGDRDRRPRRNS